MSNYLPFIFGFIAFVLFLLNILALMRLIPLVITLPLFFLSLYLMIYSASFRHMYRGMK